MKVKKMPEEVYSEGDLPSIAAIIHLYYIDLWIEIQSYLANLDKFGYDLYITLSEDCESNILEAIKTQIYKMYPDAVIIECPNRGMDIGPFVSVMDHISKVGKSYDYFVKIHSKKSLIASGAEEGAKWRRYLYEGLLGSPTKIDRILHIFEQNPDVGMIGPRGMLIEKSSSDQAANENLNQDKMKELSRKLKVTDTTLQFFRGSMFWCRFRPMFDAIVESELSVDTFEFGHAPDKSFAHAMERLFPSIIRSKGGRVYQFDETMPKTIRLLKDKHRGEDIYVIGAGASCDYLEPSFFKGKNTIGVNKVYKRFQCTYILMKEYIGRENELEMLNSDTTPVIAKWYSGNINEGQRQLNTLFTTDPRYYYFDHLENRREIVDLSVIGSPGDHVNDKLVVSYSTITTAIHFAAYLGAANIILVGHDCGLLDGKSTFDGYYGDMIADSPWNDLSQYKAWLGKIEAQTIAVRNKVKEIYGCNIVSINPFINFGLEGHAYTHGTPD